MNSAMRLVQNAGGHLGGERHTRKKTPGEDVPMLRGSSEGAGVSTLRLDTETSVNCRESGLV